ncbi:MAG: tRNA (N6-threonylcarbamoyladenosine(37)-N6)-methyltransferase TrmO [Limisphaerales bacterium]
MNSSHTNSLREIRLKQIGVIHSQFKQATGTPIQPCRAGNSAGYATLRPEFVDGLEDLAGFDRVWLVYWFHRAAAAKMKIVPYRDTVERGLFATRAPARPNPLGMSCVRLLNIEGCILRLDEVDILDDTPLLDIKPYVPQYDNYPIQRCGWLDTVPDKPVVADDRFERKSFLIHV